METELSEGTGRPPLSVLMVGKSRVRETGNATTLQRLRCHVVESGWQCDICDPDDYSDRSSVAEAIVHRDVVLGLHLYRSASILTVCKDVNKPYVAVFGGTDVNECLKDPFKMEVMTKVVMGAAHLLAFTSAMKDAALGVWPDLRPERVTVLPQAISVRPNNGFDIAQYLRSIDEDHVRLSSLTMDECIMRCTDNSLESSSENAENRVQMRTDSFHEEDRKTGHLGDPGKGEKMTSLNTYYEESYLGASREQADVSSRIAYPLLVLVAGLRPVKDVLYVANVFSEWNSERGGYGRLLIIGPALDSDYSRQVHGGAARLCGVRVTGTLGPSECHAVIAASTALVNSSLSEGMSAALLEAMALGTPVLARDIPGNRAVVEHDVTGLLYSDPASFILQLNRLLNDPKLSNAITHNAASYVALHHHNRDEAATLLTVLHEASCTGTSFT